MRGGGQMDFQQIVLGCNKEGMDFLRKGQFKQAFEQLKYAEAVLVSSQQDEPTNLLAMTCNNLGCYYKKVGKLHAALSYLRKALKIEISLQTDDVTVAGTHLNICAILSKLEKHDKAVQHALCALELITNRVSSVQGSVSQDDYSVLAIAYHNVAVERDYLHQWDEAADAYMQGHEVAKKCLGDQHPLTQTLAKNSAEALQKSRRHRGRQAGTAPAHQPSTTSALQAHQQDHSAMLPEIASARGSKDPDMAASESLTMAPVAGHSPQVPPALYPEDSPAQQASAVPQQQASPWRGPAPAVHMPQGSLQATSPLSYQRQRQSPTHEAVTPTNSSVPSLPPVGDGSFAAHWMQSQMRDPPPLQETPASLQEPLPQVPPSPFIPPAASPPPLIVAKSPRSERPSRQIIEPVEEPRGLPEEAFQAGKAPGGMRNGRPPPGPAARAMRQAERERNAARLAASAGQQATAMEQQAELARRKAAIQIQRAWRQHHRYKRENAERWKRQKIAATMIQARWRAFHIRKVRLDKVATLIQKNVRRWLVARMMVKRRATVTLQAHLRAYMCRRGHSMLAEGAVQIQRVARGMQARQYAKDHREAVMKAVPALQAGARGMKARREVRSLRKVRNAKLAREAAATSIQKVWRGLLSRRKASAQRVALARDSNARKAATKIQAAIRRYLATRKVMEMRQQRLAVYNAAATTIRKYWLRKRYQHRYQALRQEFVRHQDSVVTIQRYMRGFLVRLRLWRQALRSEEELWAAREIQRLWRGYIGRVKWEMLFEATLSRQKAAQKLQRHIRGWLARTRVHRLRRRRARQDFERARRRFKAAQKIQALARGHLGRRKVAAHRAKIVWAATTIQRMTRGHQLRKRLWLQVKHRKATQLQAAARGMLVRRRRIRIIAVVIHIQRAWRQYRRHHSKEERQLRVQAWRERREKQRIERAMAAPRTAVGT